MELVPVGHDLGAFHDGAGRVPVRQVRVGADIEELAEDRYAAWLTAHQTDPRASHGDEVVDDLRKRRLLADATDPMAFAAAHRLLPLALGLGNTQEEPWLFSAGLLYAPIVAMTGPLYDLWQWGHLSPDLWSACREAAAVAMQAGVTEPEQSDPAEVLAGLLETLPHLLTARVVCFDVRIEGLR